VRVADQDTSDPEAEAVRKRLQLRVGPALVFMTGAGDILHRQYARLYPAYDAMGQEMPDWPESLLTIAELLDLVGSLETRRDADESVRRSLQELPSAENAVALAQIEVSRGWPDRAEALLTGALRAGEDVHAREALTSLLAETGRTGRAREEYERLVQRNPLDERHVRWSQEAALLRLQEIMGQGRGDPAVDRQIAPTRKALDQIARSTADPELVLRIRLALARAAHDLDDDATFARELAWLAAHTGPDETCRQPWSAGLLLELINLEFSDDDKSLLNAYRHGWQLIRTFPDSPEAQIIKHGRLRGVMPRPGEH